MKESSDSDGEAYKSSELDDQSSETEKMNIISLHGSDSCLTDNIKRSVSCISTISSAGEFCRICHCEGTESEQPLIRPCLCSGTVMFVHQSCLQKWIKSSDIKKCELCKYEFHMEAKVKPFRKVCYHY